MDAFLKRHPCQHQAPGLVLTVVLPLHLSQPPGSDGRTAIFASKRAGSVILPMIQRLLPNFRISTGQKVREESEDRPCARRFGAPSCLGAGPAREIGSDRLKMMTLATPHFLSLSRGDGDPPI